MDQVRSAANERLQFAPGDRREYSNAGYSIVAEIIREVTGKRWPEVLTEEILDPLRMTRTYPESVPDSSPNRARGYTDNDRLADVDVWVAEIASGGLLSTAPDLAKWGLALRNEALLTGDEQRETWEPVVLNDGVAIPSGLGWELESLVQPARRSVSHSGQIPGFRCEYIRFIDDDLTIIVLMNMDDVDSWTIVNGLVRMQLTESAVR
jgi:CubicO group peptidase (beta-lactamase class C family)